MTTCRWPRKACSSPVTATRTLRETAVAVTTRVVLLPRHQEVADGIDTRLVDRRPALVERQDRNRWRGRIRHGPVAGSARRHRTSDGHACLRCTPIDGWIWGNEYVNGAYQLALNHVWGFSTTGQTRQPSTRMTGASCCGFFSAGDGPRGHRLGEPFIRDWISHPVYDDYWRKISVEDRFARMTRLSTTLGVGSTRIPRRHFAPSRAYGTMRK